MPRENEYEIGYGKPPEKTRFAKGRSGNPRGRPKGSQNLGTIFRQVSQRKVRIVENGKPRSVTLLQASILQIANKAATGDIRAFKELIALERIFAESEKVLPFETPDREKDEVVMRAMLTRMREDGQRVVANELEEEAQENETKNNE
jgi:hypothetical protein